MGFAKEQASMLAVFSDRCKRAFNDRFALACAANLQAGVGVKGLDFTYKIVWPSLGLAV